MAFFAGSERGIGRGEIAESRIEAPFLAGFMVLCGIALFLFHFYVQNPPLTTALAVSMIVFGATVIRVDYGIYILVVAMMLSPEIAAGNVGQNAERGLNLRYDDILIIVIFIGVLVKMAFEGRPMLWRPNPINAGIFAYYFVCTISTLNAMRISVGAYDHDVAMFVMMKMLQFYMIFFMVGLSVTSLKDIRNQLGVFLAVSIVVSIYAITSIGRLPRVSAPFEVGGTEPNTLGGYLMIVACTALGLLVYAPSKGWRSLFGGIAVLSLIPFIWTLSRASYLSVIVAFLVVGLMSRRLWIVSLVALVLVLSPIIMPKDVRDRVNYTFQEGEGKPVLTAGERSIQVDKSTYERIYVWQKVRFNLSVWPWFGGGVSWENVLDSQYARVLIETGIFGAIAFTFLIWRIVRTLWQSFRWSSDWVVKGLALGTTGASIGLVIHGMGTISFLIVRIMEPFWFLAALCVVGREIALNQYEERLREHRERQRAPQPPPVPQAARPAPAHNAATP